MSSASAALGAMLLTGAQISILDLIGMKLRSRLRHDRPAKDRVGARTSGCHPQLEDHYLARDSVPRPQPPSSQRTGGNGSGVADRAAINLAGTTAPRRKTASIPSDRLPDPGGAGRRSTASAATAFSSRPARTSPCRPSSIASSAGHQKRRCVGGASSRPSAALNRALRST